jgi:hypothetical protein
MKSWAPVAMFASTAGRPIAVRGVALIAGLALPAAVLLGPQAVPPSEVAGWFDHSATFRALLLVAAAVVATPVLAPGLVAPGTTFCRSLPVARVQWILLTAVSALAVQAPALVLFCAAGAWADAAALGCTAAAGALTLAAGLRDAQGIAAAATASAAVVVGIPGRVSVPLAVAMLGLTARVAWIRAPERAARRGSAAKLLRGAPWYALSVVHGLRLLRQDAVTLGCWVSVATGTGLLAALVVHNRGGIAATPTALIVLLAATPPLVLINATTCQRVLDNERRLRWMLDVTGTSGWQRHAAAALAVSFMAALSATIVAASAALSERWSAQVTAHCLLSCTVWGLSLGLLLIALGRHALRGRPKDVARHTMGAAVLGFAALVVLALFGEKTAYAALAVAVVLSLRVALQGHERTHD